MTKALQSAFSIGLLGGGGLLAAATTTAPALYAQTLAPPAQSAGAQSHDGQHDFDFNVGVWHTHIKRILDPMSGSTHSVSLDGTVRVRKVWDGRAQLEEIEADGPNGHWEGLTLFLYNPQSHQWSQTFADSKSGSLTTPLIGSFQDGRGDLYSQDTFNGRSVMVRGRWSGIKPDAHRYEESYSDDGGATWSPAFIADLTRESEPAKAASSTSPLPPPGTPGHAFDFDFGTWKTETSRLQHPLRQSTVWNGMSGTTEVQKLWGGRANLAVLESDGSTGHLELLSLRIYNPESRQWSLNFATSNVGVLSVPMIGEFENTRGVFYDQEPFDGRSILVRFIMTPLAADSARSEQAFSNDGGKTWETNWVNRYTRVKNDSER